MVHNPSFTRDQREPGARERRAGDGESGAASVRRAHRVRSLNESRPRRPPPARGRAAGTVVGQFGGTEGGSLQAKAFAGCRTGHRLQRICQTLPPGNRESTDVAGRMRADVPPHFSLRAGRGATSFGHEYPGLQAARQFGRMDGRRDRGQSFGGGGRRWGLVPRLGDCSPRPCGVGSCRRFGSPRPRWWRPRRLPRRRGLLAEAPDRRAVSRSRRPMGRRRRDPGRDVSGVRRIGPPGRPAAPAGVRAGVCRRPPDRGPTPSPSACPGRHALGRNRRHN
jgi:hypothetical protein